MTAEAILARLAGALWCIAIAGEAVGLVALAFAATQA